MIRGGVILNPVSSKSLRIAYCLPELYPHESGKSAGMDAAYLQQLYISSGLQARGHQLTYLSPINLREMVYTFDLKTIKPVPRSWTRTGWFDYLSRGIWRLQRAMGIPYLNVFSNLRYFDACVQCFPGHDLVQERYSLYNVGVAMACRKLNLPYILFFDADQLMELDYLGEPITGLLRRRATQILRYNLRVARGVICVSDQSKVHLINHWKIPEKKIAVFPNAVDVERFKPDPRARLRTRASLGIETNPIILFVGNFYKWHDLVTLLKAFREVVVSHPETRLVLVGDGPERQVMMQLTTELGLSESVIFTGLVNHEDIPGLINSADIAVAPIPLLETELWLSPMKIYEYMASGVAVVATASGQVMEVIRNGVNGWLVSPGDQSGMAKSIIYLIENPDLRLKLGEQARQDAITRHSWIKYIERLENFYIDLLAHTNLRK